MPVLIDPKTGERYENVPDEEADRAQSEFGLVTPERWAAKQEGLGGTVKTGFEGALGVATELTEALGGNTPEETEQLRAMLRTPEALARKEENPLAHGIGQSLPSVAAGGALGGATLGGAALGLGVESVASGASQEAANAALEGREFDLGNAAEAAAIELAIGTATLGAVKVGNLFLGGAGKGVMNELPKGIAAGPGNVKRAATAVEAASDEGVVDVMAQAAEGATKKKAKIATDLPPGPERAEALASTADVHYDRMATEFAEEADKVDAVMSKLGDTSASPMVEQRLRETIGEQSPAQMRAVTETTELGSAFRRELTKPLDEVAEAVDEAPLKWADDSPPVSGTQPLQPFKDGEGFSFETGETLPREFKKGDGYNFETGQIEKSSKPAKPAKPRTLATTNKLRGIASEIDTTIRNMTTKLDESSDSVEWYLAMRKAKQEMQDKVRMLSNMENKGDEVLHAKLQKLSDDFATHLKNELTKQEHWGKAAEIEAGINAAWHDKWLKGRLVAQGDLARKVGRQYRTGRELVEYDPAKIRSFMKGDKVSRTVTQRHLDNIVDGWEDMAKVHELHGTASPADIKLLRDASKRARERMALVDEIQDAVAGRVTKKANPYVDVAMDVATDLIPGGAMIRGLVKKGLKTQVGQQATSAAYDRARSILGRRQGQTGAVVISGSPTRAIDKVSTKLAKRLEKFDQRLGKGRSLDADNTAAQQALEDAERAIADAETEAAESQARAAYAAAEERISKLDAKADRLAPSKSQLEDAISEIEEAHTEALDELLGDAAGPELLAGEAKQRYDAIKRNLDELKEIKAKHTTSEDIPGHGRYDTEDTASVAREYLAKLQRSDTESGFVSSGLSVKDILSSPMGITSGAGLVGAGALGYAKSQRDLETQADRLVSTDESGKLMTKQTGRTLAGVGSNYNDRNSGEELPPAPTALGRFSDGYADPESSFEAKRKLLDAEQISPTVLYEVMGASFGDLPRMSPELFQQMAQRTAQGIRYLRENMPAGIQVSLLYPDGTPPSRSALREWATMWNTFTDPETVLEDINNGTAVPLQMKTLKDIHPDIYDQLRADVIEQVGTHFRSVPTSTKAQLDLLFQADGLAGPMWSSAAADQIGKAMAGEKEKGMTPGAQAGGGEPLGAANGPGGIEAIQSSVTNKGG